jgi:zinc protease
MKNIIIAFTILLLNQSIANAFFLESQTHVLDNGMRIVYLHNDNVEHAVYHSIIYNVGSYDEDPASNKTGLAHFLEHLMFKATKIYSSGDYDKFVKRHGGSGNAETSFDYTKYYAILPKNQLSELMQREADRMRNLVFSQELIDAERLVVLEELVSNTEQNPYYPYSMRKNAILYGSHPYGRDVIGTRSDVENISIDDLTEFYQRYYVPNNATVVIEGNIGFDTIIALAEEYYGPIKASDLPPKPSYDLPGILEDTRIDISLPHISKKHWCRTYKLPILNQDQEIALNFLQQVFTDGTKSILFDQFLATGLASTINLDYSRLKYGSSFSVNIYLREEISFDQIEEKFNTVIESFFTNDFSDDVLISLKNRMLSSDCLFALKFPTSITTYEDNITINRPLDTPANYKNNLLNVTAASIKVIAKLLFQKAPYVTSTVTPDFSDSPE